MPKTKLGQEIKNYGKKRRKASLSSSCTLNPSLDSPEVKEFIRKNLSKKVTEAVSEDVTVCTDPAQIFLKILNSWRSSGLSVII